MVTRIVSRAGHGPGGAWETALARPHPRLRPGVISYRGIRLALDRPRRRLEAPIGAATLLLGFEQPLRISRVGRPPVTLRSVFSGPTTTAAVGEHDGRLAGIEVLLAPGPRSRSSAHRSTNSPTGPWIPTNSRMDWARGRRARAGADCGASVNSPPRWPRCRAGRNASNCWTTSSCAGTRRGRPVRHGWCGRGRSCNGPGARCRWPGSPRTSAGAYGSWRIVSGNRSGWAPRRRPGCCAWNGPGGCSPRGAHRRRRRRPAGSTTRPTSAASSGR